MSERGGHSNPEQPRETYKKLFLNKWSALLGIIVVAWGIKLGLDEEKTEKMKDEVENTLHLDDEALPKDEEDARRGAEAIESLHRALQDAIARREVEGGGAVSHAPAEDGAEPKVVESELVKATPLYVVVREKFDNGLEWYKKYDLTYPDEETATDENYAAIQDYFKSDCSGWTVERENQWEYKANFGGHNPLWVRVEEDGSYTVGSLTGLEDERNVGSMGEIAEVLRDKEKILSMVHELEEQQMTTQEFKKKLKEMGYLPTGVK
ncbi:hypothetical protein HY945_00865 [Candidatus Gottesmanbacteria bacterium]|nr:hypothetical protein [Candidatus Gottesmanbacteria bacterium]